MDSRLMFSNCIDKLIKSKLFLIQTSKHARICYIRTITCVNSLMAILSQNRLNDHLPYMAYMLKGVV